MTTERQERTPAPIRIDLGRGLRALLFTLVLPMSLVITTDLLLGSLPWLTIAGVLICIPLATVVVNRTILGEFDRVVALVAPPLEEDSEVEDSEVEDSAEDSEVGTVEKAAEEPVGQTGAAAGETVEQDGNGEPPAQMLSRSGSGAAADSTPTDWPLDGQPFTEGAQRHHG